MREARELAELSFAHLLHSPDGPNSLDEPSALDRDVEQETAHFDGADLRDVQAGNARFTECAFTGVTVEGGRFARARFHDVWMHGTRWLGGELTEAQWWDCAVLEGLWSGVQAPSMQARRVTFRGCKFDSVNLRESLLDRVCFEDCDLQEVDLGSARLNSVTFPGSRIRRTRFVRAELSEVDFRGTAELDISEGFDSLGGAIMGMDQLLELAPGIATALGIRLHRK